MFITRVCRRYFADNTKRKDEDKNRNAPACRREREKGTREGTRAKEIEAMGRAKGGRSRRLGSGTRVLFSIYGTFRYREMRLFSRKSAGSNYVVRYCLQPLEAPDEKPMNGICVRRNVIDTVIVVRSHFMRICQVRYSSISRAKYEVARIHGSTYISFVRKILISSNPRVYEDVLIDNN